MLRRILCAVRCALGVLVFCVYAKRLRCSRARWLLEYGCCMSFCEGGERG